MTDLFNSLFNLTNSKSDTSSDVVDYKYGANKTDTPTTGKKTFRKYFFVAARENLRPEESFLTIDNSITETPIIEESL